MLITELAAIMMDTEMLGRCSSKLPRSLATEEHCSEENCSATEGHCSATEGHCSAAEEHCSATEGHCSAEGSGHCAAEESGDCAAERQQRRCRFFT